MKFGAVCVNFTFAHYMPLSSTNGCIAETVSVIIIAKNEEQHIAECVASALFLTNDVIVADTGSTDATVTVAAAAGATVYTCDWKGYGFCRNFAATKARHDWVLALDADERATAQLASELQKIRWDNPNMVYGFKRQNYFLGKQVRFGDWSKDKVFRLYNKTSVSWDLELVHEKLTGKNLQQIVIPGFIKHYTVSSLSQNDDKVRRYARLSAEKLAAQNKKATPVKRFLNPLFTFSKTFIFQLGFLDGKSGFLIARSMAYYTFLKYKLLHESNRKKGATESSKPA
jgi:glycosyltransferase involved in cell wall biosynthesis